VRTQLTKIVAALGIFIPLTIGFALDENSATTKTIGHVEGSPAITTPTQQPADKNIIVGQVETVFSGDVLTVIVGQYRAYVRLAGINAPDPQQAFGKQSQNLLQKLVGNKSVVMRRTGVDNCGRMIVLMWLQDENGLDISSRLVQQGAAWVYHLYTKNDYLNKLEQQARNNRLGLWSLPEDQRSPPWEWRKQAHFKGLVSVDDCRNKQINESESLMFHDQFLWMPPEFS